MFYIVSRFRCPQLVEGFTLSYDRWHINKFIMSFNRLIIINYAPLSHLPHFWWYFFLNTVDVPFLGLVVSFSSYTQSHESAGSAEGHSSHTVRQYLDAELAETPEALKNINTHNADLRFSKTFAKFQQLSIIIINFPQQFSRRKRTIWRLSTHPPILRTRVILCSKQLTHFLVRN